MSKQLIFGQPIPREMLTASGLRREDRMWGHTVKKSHAMKAKANPCIRMYGPGPENTICKKCVHLNRHAGGNKSFLKCTLRGKPTHGPATDHYANWPACANYSLPETA